MTVSARPLTGDRISIIDSFRGFALAGIVIAHMVEQYVGAMPPPELAAGFVKGTLDQVIQTSMAIFVMGKFFALFSFLFGLSFFIQMDRAAKKDIDFRGRFIWRLTILMLIGYLHSLFYRGDILTIYAPLGFLLVLFYNVRSNILLALATVLLAGAGRYIVFALYGDNTILPYGDWSPELPHNAAYFHALLDGSLSDVFASNAIHGHLTKMQFQIGYFGRWYLTFAYFLLGLLAGRYRFFVRLDELHKPIRKALWISIVCTVGFMILTMFLFSQSSVEGEGPQFDQWLSMFALTAFDLYNFSLAIVFLCSFVLIFRRPAGGRILGKLGPYGRTALSNYFLQTLLGTFVLYNWGLGFLGELTNTQTLLIALGIIGLQIILSGLWLKHYRFGPLEWLWRSATYLQWQPMRHKE
jgi:uncharacterized protein